jgi:hypothetical protein
MRKHLGLIFLFVGALCAQTTTTINGINNQSVPNIVRSVGGKSGAVTLDHNDITDWVSATSSLTSPGSVSVLAFGAVGNGKTDTTASMSAGSTTLTVTDGAFVSGDVGKYITVEGAAASAGPLVTTISAYTDSNHVTLANTASTAVSTGGSIFWGHDDTAAFVSALSAAVGQTLVIPKTAGQYEVGPLTIPSNIRILLDPGASVMALGGLTQNSTPNFTLFNLSGVSHVKIDGYGATIAMPFVEYKYEYNHCINIMGSSDVAVEGLYLNGCGGDGIYVAGTGTSGTYSSRILIDHVWSDHVHRNGLSVISVIGLKVVNSKFTNDCCDVHVPSYKNPGIDIEPNVVGDILQDIHFTNISTSGNAGAGMALSLSNVSTGTQPIYIDIDGLYSDSDGRGSLNATCFPATLVPGSVSVRGMYSTNSGDVGFYVHDWTVLAPQLDIYAPVVVNPNTATGAAQEGFLIDNGVGITSMVGNVAVHGASVTDTRGTPKTNFAYSVADYSNNGVSNVIVTLKSVVGTTFGYQTEGPQYSIEEPYRQISATPIFDASVRSNEDNAFFRVSLTGNKTSSTLINAKPGQHLTFSICQPSSGGPYTFVPPSNVKDFMTIATAANTCSSQTFIVDSNGTTAHPTTLGSTDGTSQTLTGTVIMLGGTSASQPTCAVGIRGAYYTVQAASGSTDGVQVCLKTSGDTYAWKVIF